MNSPASVILCPSCVHCPVRLAGNPKRGYRETIQGNDLRVIDVCLRSLCNRLEFVRNTRDMGQSHRVNEPQFSSSLYSLHEELVFVSDDAEKGLALQQRWADTVSVSLDISYTRRGQYSEGESICSALEYSRTC